MSLLSRERFVALIGPKSVGLVRRARGEHEVLGQLACEAGGRASQVACDAFGKLLAGMSLARGDLTVVLASDLVRFRLVPWRDEIASAAELEAYARICFEEAYGTEDGDWLIRVSPEAGGSARLAAAMERSVMERLESIAGRAGLRLRSVQPYLMVAFNRFADSFRKGDFMYVVAEPSRNTVLVARGGNWIAVRSAACTDSPISLAAVIEREMELQRGEDGVAPAVFVHAPSGVRLPEGDVRGVTPTPVGTAGGVSDPVLAMTMAVR